MKDYIAARISAIEGTQFVQFPGPNPLLVPGEEGAWDDGMLEMCDILKDNGKYYLYYHATGRGESYRIGVAVSDSPLGPFVQHGTEPILDLTFGGGSDRYIACGSILKESTDRYYLFYSLQQKNDELNYYIGLATADNPLGPWTKYEGNPIMKNFGYVGGVTKRGEKYYMFNEYPTFIKATDYGHISYATADRPEGPWTPVTDAPVMPVEDWGTWDEGGYSESNVKFDGTFFHMFYGGAKPHSYRLRSQESIGYAYSLDGTSFMKYGRNPVARREELAWGAAMAECCFLLEYPNIYVYHTLRYTKAWTPSERENAKFPAMEHIGVEVLSVDSRPAVSYTALTCPSLGVGKIYREEMQTPLSVGNANAASLTVSATMSEFSEIQVKVYLGDSPERLSTVPAHTFHLGGPKKRGTATGVFTVPSLCSRFMKLEVLNATRPGAKAVEDIRVDLRLVRN